MMPPSKTNLSRPLRRGAVNTACGIQNQIVYVDCGQHAQVYVVITFVDIMIIWELGRSNVAPW